MLYPNRMHVVTVEGTGIAKMADLKGKRVSTGSPGSATEVMAFRVIEAAGLDKDSDLQARAARRRRVGQRDQGRQDRRLLLGRRPADGGGHRPRQHARHEDQADRPRRRGRGDEQEVRQPLRRRTRSRRTPTRAWTPTTTRRRCEHPRRAREHGRQDRLQRRQDDLRAARTTSSRCTRKRSTSSSRARRRRRRRSRSIPARSSTSRRRASRSTDAAPA